MTSAASDDIGIGTPGFCSDCPYFNAPKSECRRNPPQAGMGFSKVWPRTDETDWCGEHPRRTASVGDLLVLQAGGADVLRSPQDVARLRAAAEDNEVQARPARRKSA